MRAFSSPIFSAGFRPFFLFAFISGSILPILWALIFSGRLELPSHSIPMLQWHAHEMLYGFGWAVLGGFLLTASKNWVKIRGIHGPPLALLALAWILERFAMLSVAHFPLWFRIVSLNLFLLSCGGYVCYSLIRYRRQDSFKDNYFFLIGIPLFLISKNLLLNPETFKIGAAMSIGLFRLAFAVMFERTTLQFMKTAFGISLPRWGLLDKSIKFLVLSSVFYPLLPVSLAVTVLTATGLLMLARLMTWRPDIGFRNFGVAIMFIGHFALGIHFILEALSISGVMEFVGSLSAHVFTFLCMGVVIPGMLIRISQGHTGRAIAFSFSDRVAISLMLMGAFSRLVLTQVFPEQYLFWIAASGVGWALCFALIGVRLTPFLFQARVDGKVH